MSDENGTRLDEAFEAAMRSAAVVDALIRQDEYNECIKGGGDPLACWRKQSSPALPVALPPPPDLPAETALYQALTRMHTAVDEWIDAVKDYLEEPTPAKNKKAIDSVAAAQITKGLRDRLKRMRELEECANREHPPGYCYFKYGYWDFPFPEPPPPGVLEATTHDQAWSQMHTDALNLLQAIELEMAAWEPPKP
jgi:hypothetical protein